MIVGGISSVSVKKPLLAKNTNSGEGISYVKTLTVGGKHQQWQGGKHQQWRGGKDQQWRSLASQVLN